VNLTLSAVLAFAPAVLTEAVGKGWIPEASMALLDDDDDEPPPLLPLEETPHGEIPHEKAEPLDWCMISEVTAITLARETTASTFQRAVEIAAKPRVPPWVYQGMIRHVPRMARTQYNESRGCACSSLGSCYRTSARVLTNPLFYVSKFVPIALSDIAWDVCRVLLPQGVLLRLERDKLRSNAKLKLCKHALCCGLAYIYGALIPFAWAHPIAFAVSDLAATLATDAAMGMLGLPLPL